MSRQEDFGLILAAAGRGSRFGSEVPKQFWELRGKFLFLHALEPFLDLVGEAVVVVPESWEKKISAEVDSLSSYPPVRVHTGGRTRQESVHRGLSRLRSSSHFVLVHDAARPFISPSLIELVMKETRKYGASVPVVPVRDTVKVVRDGLVVRTIDRRSLVLTQTPQGFALELLRKASETAQAEGYQGTDEASLIEYIGEDVHVVEGESENIKVTWAQDLEFQEENGSS